jgi:predicted metal-binding membrane protein
MSQVPPQANDTVARGLGMGCLSIFAGVLAYVCIGVVAGVVLSQGADLDVETISLFSEGAARIIFMVLWLLPIALPIALAVRYNGQGRGKAARGAMFSILLAFAVGALLVAACFGIVLLAFSGADFR